MEVSPPVGGTGGHSVLLCCDKTEEGGFVACGVCGGGVCVGGVWGVSGSLGIG